MVDLNNWFNCKKQRPKKKGEYLLMVSKKSFIGNWCNTYIINCYWNGKVWDLPDALKPMSWKYFKSTDDNKYRINGIMEEK